MANYKCIISSNSSLGREYTISSKSALKAAAEFGQYKDQETVTIVRVKSGRVVSRAHYNSETRDYANECIYDAEFIGI